MAKQEDFATKQVQGFKASEVHLTQTKKIINLSTKSTNHHKLRKASKEGRNIQL